MMLDNKSVISQMNSYLYQAKQLLSMWLERVFLETGENWWEEYVMDNLSHEQRKSAAQKGFSNPADFQLDILLRIIDKSWYTIKSCANVSETSRDCIHDLANVYNSWSHRTAKLPGTDIIVSDIETLGRVFTWMDCSELLSELDAFKHEIQALRNSSESESSKGLSKPQDAVPKIIEKSIVYLVGTPETKGIVFSVTELGDTAKYEVFVDGKLKTYYEGQIAPVSPSSEYQWVSTETLRSYLSAYQINNPSAGNLYSLNAARIDFVPYQFRPALKLIKADEPRILIADSVGVGKTIEAGLIIKELQARNDLENIMIICPKPLISDRKWEEEMKRFDEEFTSLTGEDLRQIISDTNRDGDWPVRYGKVIIPYSILDNRTYAGETRRRGKKFGLIDLDPPPHFDLIIIDEAHHLRNGSMDKEKAFAYKCVRYFCEHSDAVVMLTATPLQTSDDDLYTLLNLLRPDVVIDKQSFELMARPNPFISRASHIARAAGNNWKSEAKEALNGVLSTRWGENVIAHNPLFSEIQRTLEQTDVSREERVKLITDIESLHSFNTMLNRTRRKDIQNFCIRRTYTLESEFTPAQQDLYDALLSFEADALSRLHWGKGVAFMMSTIQRQAASCIFGLAPHIRSLMERRFEQLSDDPDCEFAEEDFSDINLNALKTKAMYILELAAALPDEDPKFDNVLTIIREKQCAKNNKVILFSTFRYTLAYVKRRLLKAGMRVGQIDGSVNGEQRLELRHRFALPKDDKEALDILLFTEVGAEGLDYQFCDTMINYDLPWNPMRIEQRIGRIDRRGQMSDVVNIYNVVTKGTVDADIYDRCLLRIGVFENSIGECEEILGEIGRQIEIIATDGRLTEQERQKKLEQVADNEVRKMQEMNRLEAEEKELFGFDLSGYTVSKEIQKAESPFLSPSSLLHMVEMYLCKRLGTGHYILGESQLKTLRLSAAGRAELLLDLRALSGTRNSLRRHWELYLKGNTPTHAITFDPGVAERNRKAFFITPVHPLVKQAAAYFTSNELVYVHMEYFSDQIPTGDYHMSIYAWTYVGLRSDFKLVTVCENTDLAENLPDYILTASSSDDSASIPREDWNGVEEQHISLWRKEKQRHIELTRRDAEFKLESLKNNFTGRQSILNRKIAEAFDPKIEVMYKAELEAATEKYEQKVSEIEAKIARADIHTTLIANGIITVK